MVKEEPCEKVEEVRRVIDDTSCSGKGCVEVDLWVCSTKWKKFLGKQSFYDELNCEWDMHPADDLVMCLGDSNGYVGRHVDGLDGVHGGYGVGQRNLEGRMLLEFCLEKKLCVSNTWSKREEKRKVIFRMGENETKLTLCR